MTAVQQPNSVNYRGTMTVGVAVALIAGITLGNAGTNLMPVFVDDFTARFRMSDASAGLVGAAQLIATAVLTIMLAKRAAGPSRTGMARWGLAVAAIGLLGAAVASDTGAVIVANMVLGAGLGAVYAAATAALAAVENPDKASAVAISGTAGVTALLIVAVPAADRAWAPGVGFALLALCCVPAWSLTHRLPLGANAIGSDPPVAAIDTVPAASRPSAVLLGGTVVLWAVTQGAWSFASVLGRHHTGMSPASISAVLAGSSVVALAGAVAGPIATRRFGRMPSLAGFVVVQALSMALLIVTSDPILFIAASVIWQACQLAVLVQILAAAAVIDPSGRWTASLSGAGALGNAVGPLAVGHILAGAGAGVLAIALAVGTAVASLPLLRMTVTAKTATGCQRPAEVLRSHSTTSNEQVE